MSDPDQDYVKNLLQIKYRIDLDEGYLIYQKIADNVFEVVEENLTNEDSSSLGFFDWDSVVQNLDESSDAFQCFDISMSLKFKNVYLTPDKVIASSFDEIKEAFRYIKIRSWCSDNI
jgi:hypothetical protein